jgi:mannitol/fructose-specific phosphotransferase system IIA component (Ntr-type)
MTKGAMLKIQDHLEAEWIHTGLTADDKCGVLRELAEHAGNLGLVPDEQALFHALLAREQLVTTAIGQSVAIPHTQDFHTDRAVLIPGLHPAGVDFDAPDELPVHLFLLIVSSGRQVGHHLRLLCHVSRVVRHGNCLARLRQADSPHEVFTCLLEAEQHVLKKDQLSTKPADTSLALPTEALGGDSP